MNTPMNANEIVGALKWLAKVRTYCDTHMVNCRECEFHGFCTDPDSDESIGEQAEWMNKAASLIESLQAQLAQMRKAQVTHYCANCEDMARQLAESQRRERAARNELCLKCGLYHDAHNGACDGCRWKGEAE